MKPGAVLSALIFLSLACSFSRTRPLPSPEIMGTAVPRRTDTPTSEPTATPVPTPAASASPPSVHALPDASGYRWELVADGFTQPLLVQNAGDNRLFVVEQPGTIRLVLDGQAEPLPFLDHRAQVNDSAFEQGLLGLAFHPAYAENATFYVNYTGAGGDTFISRFQASQDRNQADVASEEVILNIVQPFANHNGGHLTFGPDGYLYVGTGDGGSGGDPQGNAQRLNTLLGKLLRLDVDSGEAYAIPPDNPFAGVEGARPEIWAYGLRNPWRFSFDPATGDMYIGDVGQNSWEEIDFQPAESNGGENYGWNIREARHPFAGESAEGLVEPVAEYPIPEFGCSVTGGVVARDPGLPRWNGVYIYGDYCSGIIWGLVRDESGAWISAQLFDTDFRISSFGTGADGQVYVMDHEGGAVYRLVSEPS